MASLAANAAQTSLRSSRQPQRQAGRPRSLTRRLSAPQHKRWTASSTSNGNGASAGTVLLEEPSRESRLWAGTAADSTALPLEDSSPPEAAVSSAPTTAPEEDASPVPWSGSWAKNWYAVMGAADFDASRPQPFTLLGKHLVIWKDGQGGWCCLEDRCPHRAVPLSEGKVWSDGTLMCSYHGWRFDQSGACKAIPQASSADAEAVAAASRRACAVAHPICERQGLLFVWGEGGPAALEESGKVEPFARCELTRFVAEQGEISQPVRLMRSYTRDLPYSHASLVENLIDPAHAPWSHNGVLGSRDKVKLGQSEMRRAGPLSAFMQHVDPPVDQTKITYHPPNLTQYRIMDKQGVRSVFNFWCTPIAPELTRVTLQLATDREMPWYIKFVFGLPAWINHVVSSNTTLDGDAVFLKGQDYVLSQQAQREGADWRKLFYLPTSADSLVAAVRNWTDKYAGGGPFGSPADPSSPASAAAAAAAMSAGIPGGTTSSRRQLLDRYQQHTVHCASCRNALKTVTLFRSIAAAAAAVAAAACLLPFLSLTAGAGAAAAGGSAAVQSLAAAAAVAKAPALLTAVLCAAWLLLTKLRDAFIFQDWVHAYK